MPACKRSTFEVVESELTLQVFVHALGAPALLEDADGLLATHSSWQRGEDELGGLLLAGHPLGHEPERFSIGYGESVVVHGLHAHEAKLRAQSCLRAVTPGDFSEGFAAQRHCQIEHSSRITTRSVEIVEAHDARGRLDAHAEIK